MYSEQPPLATQRFQISTMQWDCCLKPVFLSPETPLLAAIAPLQQTETGKVGFVTANGQLVGILTQGDILAAIAQTQTLASLTVADAMGQPVVTYPVTQIIQQTAVEEWFREYGFAQMPLVDEDGTVVGILPRDRLFCQNLTPEQTPHSYWHILEAAPVGIVRHDMHGKLTYLNRKAAEITGLTPPEVLGLGWQETIYPEDRERVLTQMAIAFEEQQPCQVEGRLQRGDGTMIWGYLQLAPERNTQGEILGFTGTITDISDRKRLETALQESKHQLEDILDNAHGAAIACFKFFADCTWECLYCSPDMESIFGLGEGILKGSPHLWLTNMHRADRAQFLEPLYWSIFIRQNFKFEYRFQHQKDNSWRWIRAQFTSRYDDAQTCWIVTSVNFDITEAKNAAAAIAKSEAALLEAQHIAHIGSWEYDLDTEQLTWSPEMFRMYGLDPALPEPTMTEYWRLIHPGDRRKLRNAAEQTILTQKSYSLEYRVILSNGTIRYHEGRGDIITDDAGFPTGLIGTALDITERVLTIQALRESEQRWQFALEAAEDGLWDWNMQTNAVFLSNEWKKILGYREEEIGNHLQEWESRLHPADRERVLEDLDRCLRKEVEIYRSEYRMRGKDGVYRWIMDRGKIIEWSTSGEGARMIGLISDVSDRKQLELELRQSQARLQDILNGAQTTSIVYFLIFADYTWQYLYQSPGSEALFGYTAEEIQGDRHLWYNNVFAEDREKIIEPLIIDLLIEGDYCIEYRFHHRDGSLRWINAHYTSRYDAVAEGWNVVGVSLDITERRQIEAQLHENQRILLEAQRVAHIGHWELDAATKRTFLSAELCRMFGLAPQTATLDFEAEILAALHPEDRGNLREIVTQAIATGEGYTIDYRVLLPDGSIRYHEGRAEVETDPQGKAVRLFGTALDLTDRVLADQALRESELRWQFALEGSGDGIWDWDAQTNKVFFSTQWKTMLGFREEEIGDTLDEWDQRVHPADKGDVYALIQDHFAGKTPFYVSEHRVRCKDGSYKWILDRGKVIERAADGSPLRVIGTHSDIDQRKQTELQLQTLSQRLAIATTTANIGIWEYDFEHQALLWDEQMYRLHGVTPETFSHTWDAWRSLIHPEDRDRVDQAFLRIRTHQDKLESIHRTIHPGSNTSYHIEIHGIYLSPTDKAHLPRLIGVAWDVSDRYKAEESLIAAKEAAEAASIAKGSFLANMSHEIRTPMGGVLGMLTLLEDTQLNAQQQSYIHIAQSSATSLLSLINDILDFSKIDAGKLEIEQLDFDLMETLGDFAKSIAFSAQKKNLEFLLDLTGINHRLVRGDAGRVRQILTNLASNAIKFTEQGHVLIRIQTQAIATGKVKLTATVEDTGIGIPQTKLADLFSPFTQGDASTTRKYGGTGLGLAITKKLCELMGGKLTAESRLGVGSRFTFSLRLQGDSEKTFSLTDPYTLTQFSVLVIEANPCHRDILQRQLADWGVQVTAVASLQTAIALLEDSSNTTTIFQQGGQNLILSDTSLIHPAEIPWVEQLRQKYQEYAPTFLVMDRLSTSPGQPNHSNYQDIQGCLTKPILPTELRQILIDLESSHSCPPHSPKPPPVMPGETLTPQPLNGQAEILLVEDNRVNQMVICGLLKKLQLTHIDTAANGREALERLRTKVYDLILMDCLMPELDGYETTRAIRAGQGGDRHRDVPIIALTANAMKGDREKCLAAGMNDHVAKPVKPQLLAERLQQWLTVAREKT